MNDDIKAQIPFSKSNDPEQDLQLLEPYNYVLQVPGKKVRQSLLLAFNHWLKVDEKYLEQIGKIIQVLHNASLLLDDIQDNSVLRRGIPVAHKIFGVPSTINSANYVMFIALEQIQALGKPEAVQVFTEQMLELHRGQGMDIYWRDNHLCPTEDEYKQMTIRKTGKVHGKSCQFVKDRCPFMIKLKRTTEFLWTVTLAVQIKFPVGKNEALPVLGVLLISIEC